MSFGPSREQTTNALYAVASADTPDKRLRALDTVCMMMTELHDAVSYLKKAASKAKRGAA